MLIKKPDDIRWYEITDRATYLNRRAFLRNAALAGAAIAAGPATAAVLPAERGARLAGVSPSAFSTDEAVNSFEDASTYNNYYEFGTDKRDPVKNATAFEPRPWSITISGNAQKTGTVNLEDFLAPHALEERIYRLRCVEAWSMVIPWVGIPLADVIKRCQPLSSAKYVVFETLHDKQRMPGQRSRVLEWPYIEGLTIEEAMNPLSILAVGMYGEVLPNQNGAPIRLVVPWKYGFKSIKGIVKIHFSEKRPRTSWEKAASREYGFYANVNPEVDHPRWSQARERRIGSAGLNKNSWQSFFGRSKQETRMFNGYAEQVAHLYTGLDLRKNF